jgi:hypothetical protein
MFRAPRREVVKKCLERRYDLPPNLLYAKVGSRDCSPSWLQIESVWIKPKQVLVQLDLLRRIFILHAKLCPWATMGWYLHGPCDSFDSYPSWAENQVGEYRGPIYHSFVSSPRVPGIVEDYGRDSNSKPFLIAQIVFAFPVKTQRHSECTNVSSSKSC